MLTTEELGLDSEGTGLPRGRSEPGRDMGRSRGHWRTFSESCLGLGGGLGEEPELFSVTQ